MAARSFLPRCIAFELQIFNDSIGIRLKNAVHLGKKFLAAILSAILYCTRHIHSISRLFSIHLPRKRKHKTRRGFVEEYGRNLTDKIFYSISSSPAIYIQICSIKMNGFLRYIFPGLEFLDFLAIWELTRFL